MRGERLYPGTVEAVPWGVDDLCRVKRVPISVDNPLKTGDILVRNGAWQRKYMVQRIDSGLHPYTGKRTMLVRLKFIGNYFADGRVEIPKRSYRREIWWEDWMENHYPRVEPTARYLFGVRINE